jgi:hypothetical protein
VAFGETSLHGPLRAADLRTLAAALLAEDRERVIRRPVAM